ncbi:MOSC domain-containing protein [Streptomyces sp. NBC_00286]|uniref:MOSC domain-containing protein n=1 Tax=Streptomyces sp. NBC_00286 TaxID=2975701 RepID=UPI002E2AF6CF|nr:MOSC N-terminal beta barrel domain-containing protein [Streptomyces sp. NBC_00286]
MARVVELSYYPVKGCAGVSAHDAVLTSAGLAHDRSFMVTSEEGVYRTQRRWPRLALIRPGISPDGERLSLRAPGHPYALDIGVDTSGPRRDVDLFGAPFTGIDQGDEAAAWLTEVLGAPSRLVRVPPEHDRVTDGQVPGTSGYADSSAVHVLSRSTLDLLNGRLTESGGDALPMDRFRPNIVIGGWGDPHTEDRVRRITIADTELGYTKLAIRCAVTLVDQETGTRTGPEPLRTLASYRRAASGGGGVAFGTKYAVLRPGKLSVGDEVRVTSWGEAEL